ncbi:type IV secretion system protein VirB11 [Pseudomonas duriflava]|uniref:Type IV secretion system protein VirB11 n=2 Tax=Pseudomonas duriflava TaxID=459528 RepID=A0A562PP17_9PSED|nr:type IV secretion system protein VirB11 [Pseudomonas duriflava]
MDDRDLTEGQRRARKALADEAGPLIVDALNDPKTIEVMLNPDGKLFKERLGEPKTHIGNIGPHQAFSILSRVAGYLQKEITRSSPTLEGEWPLDNSRFAGMIPPVVQASCFAIRKKAIRVFTLDDYIEQGVMTLAQVEYIRKALREHKNIIISGGTSSGKTTAVNAVIQEKALIFPSERVYVIEDTGELQIKSDNYVQTHTSDDVSMTALLKIALRFAPDCILVGEVRGPEALDLLDAWNTGHPGGVCTLHANSGSEALPRLVSLVSRHPYAPRDIEPLVANAAQVIVHIAKTPQGRRVQEILEVTGYESGQFHYRAVC